MLEQELKAGNMRRGSRHAMMKPGGRGSLLEKAVEMA